MGTHLPSPKGGRAPSPIFGSCLLWPNSWMHQGGTCHEGGRWSRPHHVRWGPSFPLQKGCRAPLFSANFNCGQTAGCIKMPLKVGLSPGDFVFDGDSAAPREKAHPPYPILALVYCGQTVGWMKTPLGTEVDLGPGHFVLDGYPRKRHSSPPPLFGPCLLWPRSPISATAELLLKDFIVF